ATQIEQYPGGIVVRVKAEELNDANLKAVRAEASAAAASSPKLPLVLDLANVQAMPSLTLGVLIELSQSFKSRGQRLVLAKVQPSIRRLLTITRLGRVCELPDALTAFPGSAPA